MISQIEDLRSLIVQELDVLINSYNLDSYMFQIQFAKVFDKIVVFAEETNSHIVKSMAILLVQKVSDTKLISVEDARVFQETVLVDLKKLQEVVANICVVC